MAYAPEEEPTTTNLPFPNAISYQPFTPSVLTNDQFSPSVDVVMNPLFDTPFPTATYFPLP